MTAKAINLEKGSKALLFAAALLFAIPHGNAALSLLSSVVPLIGVTRMAETRKRKANEVAMPNMFWGVYDGFPTVYDTIRDRAWSFIEGSWTPENTLEVFTKMTDLGREKFMARFPNLPPLPV